MQERAVTRMDRSEAEIAPKPKVLRRPAHLSSTAAEPTPPASVSVVQLHVRSRAPITDVAVPASTTSWQDDGRFASILLAVIVVLNVIAYLIFSEPAPKQSPVTPTQSDSAGKTVYILDESGAVAITEP